jgi:CheY-like chemotaxis protein
VPIRILIADDFPPIRKSIRRLLLDRGDMSIAGEASNYAETIEQLPIARPDVLLLDLQMPAPIGFQPEKIAHLAAEIPCVVLAMSIWIDAEAAELARRLGAKICMDKKGLSDELVPSIFRFTGIREHVKQRAGSRHQCFIYDGNPSHGLAKTAAAAKMRLDAGYRFMYLNSPSMVAGMRAHLVSAGVDLDQTAVRNSALLSSELTHLVDGRFDIDRMLGMLDDAVQQALGDGFNGLWAAGDIAWQFGPEKDFTHLLEYEWRLDEYAGKQPGLSGICQYHMPALPREALLDGAATHRSFFMNESLSRVNSRYIHTDSPAAMQAIDRSGLGQLVEQCCSRP